MASTALTEFTAGARGIGARTDSAGGAVGDMTAEEDRLIQSMLGEGALTADAFKVTPDSGMTVTVGTTALVDLYVVAGDNAGQGNYLVRLNESPVSVALSPADPSQARIDQLFLVVSDSAYDASGRALPRIGRRTGDPGGGAPGPDAGWKASALLATITVGAGATTIEVGDIADARADATFQHVEDHDVTSGVHGVTGNLVGTSDTQTLSGKTLDGALFLNPDLRASVMGESARTTRPYARIRSAGSQLFGGSSNTVTSMTTLGEETDANFGDTANSRLVIPVDGLYLITARGDWDGVSNDGSTFYRWIQVNGFKDEHTVVGFTGPDQNVLTFVRRYNAADNVIMSAFQSAAFNANLTYAELVGMWLAP